MHWFQTDFLGTDKKTFKNGIMYAFVLNLLLFRFYCIFFLLFFVIVLNCMYIWQWMSVISHCNFMSDLTVVV